MDKNKLLSCDWGTSTFRLYLIDTNSGQQIDEVVTNAGTASLNAEINQLSGASRVNHFSTYLRSKIMLIQERQSISLTDIPVLISGMASSSIGIVEVPYASLPMSLTTPQLKSKKIKSSHTCPHDLYIIGGLCSNQDVIRGEESQLIGLSDLINTDEAICILPGTHSKHVSIVDQRIIDFNTYMTGEAFQLLSQQSLLQYDVSPSATMSDHMILHFCEGVNEGNQNPLLKSLFRVRSNHLLGNIKPEENYHYLSGLLIGNELKESSQSNLPIYLCGDNRLSKLYEIALNTLGMSEKLMLIPEQEMQTSIQKTHRILFNNLK